MSDPRTELFEFVLTRAESEPAQRRVKIYRALAEFAGGAELTKKLNELADELEAADRRCREFAFKLTQGGQS